MKTKSILAVTFFTIATHICFAQTNFTITKSESFVKKISNPKMFFGSIDDKLYIIEGRAEVEHDYITVLDKDMKISASEPLKSDNADKQIIKPLVLWNKVYMLSLLNDKKAEKTSASLEEYDNKTVKYLNKNTDIFSSGYIKYDANMGSYQANWLFTVSPDSSKIVFLFYHKENAYISVLDKELKQVWKNTIALDKNRISAKVSSVKLLNNGEVVLMFSQTKGNDGVDYTVYCITNNGGTVKSKDIPMDNPLFECVLYTSKDSKPYMTGMYKKLGLQKPEGFFFNEIDMKTAGFSNENKYKITNPIWPEKLSQKQRLKAEDEDFKKVKDLDKYRHKIEIVELNTGEYYFVIEQYKKNHAASPADIDYSYDNVYVCYVNTKTKKNWDHLLPKAVRTNMTERLSYIGFEKDGNLYLFYNDCVENIDKMKDTDINEYFFIKNCTPKVLYTKYNKEGFVEKKQFDTPGDYEISRSFKTYSSDRKSIYLLLSGTDGKAKNWQYLRAIWKISVE